MYLYVYLIFNYNVFWVSVRVQVKVIEPADQTAHFNVTISSPMIERWRYVNIYWNLIIIKIAYALD